MSEKQIFKGQPNPNHAPKWAADRYFHYIEKYDDLLNALEDNRNEFIKFLQSIPQEKWDDRYAADKWSIKGVVSHIIDTERVFQYRAMRHSRHDLTNLPGFDENAYEPHSNLENRSVTELIHEFDIVRLGTNILFAGMNESNLDFVGTANDHPFSARSAGWMIVGHAMHHVKIIQERYL
ncbi:MAG: DinB family protein [Crocinitomicaceae bacterium]